MNNNKLMLVFGLSDEDKAFLESTINEHRLPSYKIIEPSMASMKIRDIIDGIRLDTYDKKLPDEKVVIFNNFTDEELDRAIKSIRSNKNFKPILAVVTPSSFEWEFHYLLEHLIEEREQARRYMQSRTQG